MRRTSACLAAALTVLLGLRGIATAQTREISLVAPDSPRWDVAGTAGWFGRSHVATPGTLRDETWLNAGSFAASLGYHWTPHLKIEGEVATSSTASFYTVEPLMATGRSTLTFVSREHAVKTTLATGRVVYQFFENRWVHPFVTAGAEVAHDRDRTEISSPPFAPTGPLLPPVIELETQTTSAVRPVLGGGFKFYVAERAFIRTDAAFSFGHDGVANLSWATGIGFDF